MRVVFAYQKFTSELGHLFGHFAKRNSRWPPLPLALLAAASEEAGHEAIILDGEANDWSTERLARETVALKPDIVGISAYSPFYHLSVDLAEAIKRINRDIPVAGGGPHFTITQEKAMRPCFDYGFVGEAEDSWPEFLNAMSSPKYLAQVKGLMFRRDGELINNFGARWIRTEAMTKKEIYGEHPLDRFPLPARHLLPMRKYRLGNSTGRSYFTSIQTARGCPWRCIVAGTEVLMYDGTYAKVESLEEGDMVACANLREGVQGIGTVSKTGQRIADDIYRLKMSDGSQIDITGDHPVWTKAGWRRVKNLQSSSEIFSLPDLRERSTCRPEDLRLSTLRERENKKRQNREQESSEAIRNQTEDWSNFERAAWPSIVGFHARKEYQRQDVGESQTNERVEKKNFSPHDVKQSDAAPRNSSATQRDNETLASRRLDCSATSQRDERVREAVGQDFSSSQTADSLCRLQEILDRTRPIWQTSQSRLYSHDGEVEESSTLQRETLAYSRKHPRAQKRLYRSRLERVASVGRIATEKQSTVDEDARRRVSPRWVRIVDITFLGRGLVYTIAVAQHKNFFANNLLVHNCIFCASDALMTTRYIMKSPRRVVEEMADVAERFPFISHLYIVDDVLTFWPEHITEIVDRMDAEGLKFTFESSTRANLVDDKLIKRLAKSGLIRLSFGLETVDPVMRVTMQKKVPLEAYTVANKICSNYGVEAMNSLMIGLPGETRESVRNTINWVAKSRDIKQANLAIAIPYPGTEFADMAAAGTHGVELLDSAFEKYTRYGNAVTNVGELTSKDLVKLQNWGFVKIYFKWFRIMPVIHKHGILGFLLQFVRLFRIWRDVILDKTKPFRTHPGVP